MRKGIWRKRILAAMIISSILLTGSIPAAAETIDDLTEEILVDIDDTAEEELAISEGELPEEIPAEEALEEAADAIEAADSIEDIVEEDMATEITDEYTEDLDAGTVAQYFGSAEKMELDTQYTINSNEVYPAKYFWFSPTETATYAFESFYEGQFDPNYIGEDPVLRIYTSDGSLLRKSDDEGTGSNFQQTVKLTKGSIYYLEAGFFPGSYGVFYFKGMQSTFTMDYPELIKASERITLKYAWDPKYFRFIPDKTSVYEFTTGTLSNTSLTSYVRVSEESGNQLGYNKGTADGLKITLTKGKVYVIETGFEAGGTGSLTLAVYDRGTDGLSAFRSKNERDFAEYDDSTQLSIWSNMSSDILASPGETVSMEVEATSPAGTSLMLSWFREGEEYNVLAMGKKYETSVTAQGMFTYVCMLESYDSSTGKTSNLKWYFTVDCEAGHDSLASAKNADFDEYKNAYLQVATSKNNGEGYTKYTVPETAIYEASAYMDTAGTIELLDETGAMISTLADGDKILLIGGRTYYVKFRAADHSTRHRAGASFYYSEAHNHNMSGWYRTSEPTALVNGVEGSSCAECGYTEYRQTDKLAPFITLNVSGTLPMKVKQKTTKVKVTGIQTGDRIVSWTSSNPKYVKVDGNGKITAGKKAKKTATITVRTEAGATASFKVKTQKKAVAAKTILVAAKSVTLAKNAKFNLTAQIFPITVTTKARYSSSKKSVATVSKSGVITAKKKGKATITVKCGKKKVKVKVTVR